MSTTQMYFANRAAEVTYIISQGQTPAVPLPVDSKVLPKTLDLPEILVLPDTETPPGVYGYRVKVPQGSTTDYTLGNDGSLESCATKAVSQVDGLACRSSTSPRTVRVVTPD